MMSRAILIMASCLFVSCHHELVSPHDPACSPGQQPCDVDRDGIYTPEDCNDLDPSLYPGATEVPYDGIDQDCSGADQNDFDADGYPSTLAGGADCDDQNEFINPGVQEVCDGLDNNCDGASDIDAVDRIVCYADSDGDGFGDPDSTVQACNLPIGYILDDTDCDDEDADVYPAALESCNGLDDNCDGRTDEGYLITYYQDADSDGYGSPQSTIQACTLPTGYLTDHADCNDTTAAVHPGAVETCNGMDDNCNGQIDEGFLTNWYQDTDSDGYGSPSVSTQSCLQPPGYVANNIDCDDTTSTVSPGVRETVCNGIDDNCNGLADDHPDLDSDGYDQCDLNVNGADGRPGDCDDTSPAVYPGVTSIVCNGIDDGCIGIGADHPDLDGDGYDICPMGVKGADGSPVDCADTEPTTYPGAYDIIGDKIDSNCNGMVDQAFVFAGTGTAGFGGDGGPATKAQLYYPWQLAVDSGGSLLIADAGNGRVRKVSNGLIMTVAGNGQDGSNIEGVPATNVGLHNNGGVAVDANGNLYISEFDNNGRIRKVDTNGIASILVTLALPLGLAIDPSGRLFVTGDDQVVRQIKGVDESLVVVGTPDVSGTSSSGDEGPAVDALLFAPEGVTFSSDGRLFISENNGCRVRYVDASGIIHAYAVPEQNAKIGALAGDGFPATSSEVHLSYPTQLAFDSKDNLYIADTNNKVIRKVDSIPDHIVSTVAGGGIMDSNGISATEIELVRPTGVVVDAMGNLYISDNKCHRIWIVIP